MIETTALLIFLAVLGTPLLLGAVWSILTRPRPYYHKWRGSGYQKIKYRK